MQLWSPEMQACVGWESLGKPRTPAAGFAAFLLAFAAGACQGQVSPLGGSDLSTDGLPPPAGGFPEGVNLASLGVSPVRRLSRAEIRNSLQDAWQIDLPDEVLDTLPQDAETPFDNDAKTQSISAALLVGLRRVGAAVGLAIVDRGAALTGCSAVEDDCLAAWARTAGRRLLRRDLDAEEVTELAALSTEAAGDPGVAAGMIAEALVLDPEFIFRLERGTHRAGVLTLDGPSIASRISFLIWGSGPDDALLDAAVAGDLAIGAERAAHAARLLDDPRAARQLQRFHAMWLDYDTSLPPISDLNRDLRAESDALIARVILEDRLPLSKLFTFEETFLTSALAQHYGVPDPGAPSWVNYPDDARRGLLSHGAYLSTGSNFGDTSPTQRGLNVLERLLCREVPSAPDNVDVDEPPPMSDPDGCKEDVWNMLQLDNCKGCHRAMDGLGIGLEQYGPWGQFREQEPGRPDCVARSQGTLPNGQPFSGPAALGVALAELPELSDCFVRQMSRFVLGRGELEEDGALVSSLQKAFLREPQVGRFLERLVASEFFVHREIEDH